MLPPVPVEATAPAPDAFAARAWGSFERSPALRSDRERVEIAVDGRTGDQLEYKLRLTPRFTLAPDEHLWTNSRTCPAVRVVLERLRALQPPAIVPPGFAPSPTQIIVDGFGYRLTAPLADPSGMSRITWTSNIGTPLAAWVEDSLARLKPCWSAVELRVAR